MKKKTAHSIYADFEKPEQHVLWNWVAGRIKVVMLRKNCISWVALVASIVAILMSGMAMVKQNENPELAKDAVADIVYDRVVAEVADELKPVYSDMGLEFPSNASSLSELFKPLVGITQDMTVEE